MKRKLTKLEKFGLIAAVITGMLFFYLKHVYDPQQEALQKTQEQLNRSIRDFNALQAADPLFQLQRRLESRQKALEELREEMKVHDIHPSTEEELLRSQHWIVSLLERGSVRVLQVTPSGSREDGLFTWHVYKVALRGDFDGLLKLLRELPSHSTPLQVKEVVVGGGGWPLNISMNLWILS